jgi:methionine sulfoxide reductase heme-binding subunit
MPIIIRRILIFILSLIPLGFIGYKILINDLGADPAKAIVLFTGNWAFYFLLITLAVTPLKRLIQFKFLHFRWLQLHRRMLGLFTLFYALLHLISFLWFVLGWDFSRFDDELIKRPYILVSMPAVILLIALGVTSTQGMMKRLGKKWLSLHKTIYLIAILAWLHVLMQVRSSYFDAVFFGMLVFLLLAVRWNNFRWTQFFYPKNSGASNSNRRDKDIEKRDHATK